MRLVDREYKAAKAVEDLLPDNELTKETRNLTNRLHLFLDIKDANYHVIQSLMAVKSFDEWKVEEVVLMEEFRYKSIAQARSDFRRLVLTRIEILLARVEHKYEQCYI